MLSKGHVVTPFSRRGAPPSFWFDLSRVIFWGEKVNVKTIHQYRGFSDFLQWIFYQRRAAPHLADAALTGTSIRKTSKHKSFLTFNRPSSVF